MAMAYKASKSPSFSNASWGSDLRSVARGDAVETPAVAPTSGNTRAWSPARRAQCMASAVGMPLDSSRASGKWNLKISPE